MLYDQKVFRSVTNTDNGEVSAATTFRYRQEGAVVWADYGGGSIVKGFIIGIVLADNSLDMRYQHVNQQGELMTGRCHSIPELLPDGRIRLHERWQWTCKDFSSGESIIEEIT